MSCEQDFHILLPWKNGIESTCIWMTISSHSGVSGGGKSRVAVASEEAKDALPFRSPVNRVVFAANHDTAGI
jgi:hypothetical protein